MVISKKKRQRKKNNAEPGSHGIRLHTVSYSEFVQREYKWQLPEFRVFPINLVVGKNASGKTRLLTLIASLARLLCDRLPVSNLLSTHFVARFTQADEKAGSLVYSLDIEDREVQAESLSIGSTSYLNRRTKGEGDLFTAEVNQSLGFSIEANQLAAHLKRDTRQHPFLEPLNKWARSAIFFRFGNELAQRTITVMAGTPTIENMDLTAGEGPIVPLLLAGISLHGDKHLDRVSDDMREIGFPVSRIELIPAPIQVTGSFGPTTSQPALMVRAHEADRDWYVDQAHMASGMFRALCCLAHLHIAQHFASAGLFIIDDIGEGLDHQRSSNLIRLLVKRAEEKNFQLLMATNDRFVMNAVPLSCWQVIHREGSSLRIINQDNSSELFDRFRKFGLSNFDFFSRSAFLTPQAQKQAE